MSAGNYGFKECQGTVQWLGENGKFTARPIKPFRCFVPGRLPKKIADTFKLHWRPLFTMMEEGLDNIPHNPSAETIHSLYMHRPWNTSRREMDSSSRTPGSTPIRTGLYQCVQRMLKEARLCQKEQHRTRGTYQIRTDLIEVTPGESDVSTCKIKLGLRDKEIRLPHHLQHLQQQFLLQFLQQHFLRQFL
jgi:hypothetical protein